MIKITRMTKEQQRKSNIGCLVFIVLMVAIVFYGFSSGGCTSREVEAELAVKDFITQTTGIKLKSYGHSLKTEEIGLQVEHIKYRVTGNYVAENGKRIFVKSVVEQLAAGWRLEYLSIDGEVLYER